MRNTPTRRPLNQKQRHFLDRYHITGNLGQSWLDAGYCCTIESATSNAGRVLQRPDAREYLQSLQQYDRQHTGLTREKLLTRLEAIIDSETARDRDVIWACREAGRMIGAYQPRPEPGEAVPDPLLELMREIRKREAHRIEPSRQSVAVPRSDDVQSSPHSHVPEMEEPPSESPDISQSAESRPNEPPREQHSSLSRERAVRTSTGRDPDWHPLYNPHYDPTVRKRQQVETIRPGTR